ncbi:MAG: hypothetical protein CVT67_08355 [Actinobacteria bacterium HGW-Actinobacteria-7]|nr:MAG: hypothetical protein CVT67_08355 [Actinobacteria bacterium HGW-Actinobacteria-7]
MISRRRTRLIGVVLVAVLALAMALLAGCGKKAAPVVENGPSALGSLAVAQSALSTTAPDAKLLLVQTVQGVEPTGTPTWAFLFGSPTSDKTYVVYMAGGKSMGSEEYGTAGLDKTQWAAVPGLETWKIDSDEAYTKAFTAGGGKGVPLAYVMGLTTYKPEGVTSTVEPFVWSVQFDPGESGVTTSPVNVNASTGEASIRKN